MSKVQGLIGYPQTAGSPGGAAYDEKNIRRRVYDALNVLMAMDIITKDKKEISWQGLPTAPASQLERLKQERSRLRARVAQQQAYLKVCLSYYPCQPQVMQHMPSAHCILKAGPKLWHNLLPIFSVDRVVAELHQQNRWLTKQVVWATGPCACKEAHVSSCSNGGEADDVRGCGQCRRRASNMRRTGT